LENGTLYGVGVGPGDPELMTIKAARALREADVVAIPDTGKGDMTAMNIAREHIAGKELLYCSAPMGAGRAAADSAYDAAAAEIAARLGAGKNVAFITLGDPSVYSTYAYVQRRVAALGYATRTIPGVPSFCAAAALTGGGLCEGAEPLIILPGSCGNMDAYLTLPGAKVVMKAASKLPALTRRLIEDGRFDVAVASNCGMAGEKLALGAEALDSAGGYFSIIILKDRG
jgi:precorrin-2/cobalt-factor-2 C20-methyltransferase